MNQIREIRKARNMSQATMVILSGGVLRHQMRISQIERGEVEPTGPELVALSHLLGVSREVLLGEEKFPCRQEAPKSPTLPPAPPRPKIEAV